MADNLGQSNQLSRYGAVSKVLPNLSIGGRSFFVLNGSQSWYGNLLNAFPSDGQGQPRVFQTIAAALAACTANRGDVIYVLPNHTESITSSTYLNANVAGVRIQGMGEGNNRPYLTLTTATSAILTVSAANVTFDNIILDGTGVASLVTMATVTAAGVTFSNCKFITANSTNQAGVAVLTTAAANQLTFDSCYFEGSANAGTTNALQLVGGTDIFIRNCTFIGNYTTSLGPINNITTAITNLVVDGCTLINNTASSTKAIVLLSGTTGMIRNNRIAVLSGSAASALTAAGMYVGGNYAVYAAGTTAGTLI